MFRNIHTFWGHEDFVDNFFFFLGGGVGHDKIGLVCGVFSMYFLGLFLR